MSEETKGSIDLLSNPIITLLIGAFIGFLFSIWKDIITDGRKQEKEKKELTLKRLDEAFVHLSKSSDNTRKTFTNMLDTDYKKPQFNEASTKLAFIIRVHFPHLLEKYQEYLDIQFKYGTHQIQSATLISDLMNKQGFNQQVYDSEILKYQINKDTLDFMKKFENSFGELCTLLVDEAKKI